MRFPTSTIAAGKDEFDMRCERSLPSRLTFWWELMEDTGPIAFVDDVCAKSSLPLQLIVYRTNPAYARRLIY